MVTQTQINEMVRIHQELIYEQNKIAELENDLEVRNIWKAITQAGFHVSERKQLFKEE